MPEVAPGPWLAGYTGKETVRGAIAGHMKRAILQTSFAAWLRSGCSHEATNLAWHGQALQARAVWSLHSWAHCGTQHRGADAHLVPDQACDLDDVALHVVLQDPERLHTTPSSG